jgi:hypothetical protein
MVRRRVTNVFSDHVLRRSGVGKSFLRDKWEGEQVMKEVLVTV